jgi:hypothetical protein
MKLDVTKGKEKESAESDIGMTLGANGGNPTDVTGNRETVRDNYEGVAKVDLTGGEDSDRINDCMAVLGTPGSNPASSCSVPAASFLDGCCHHDSAKNSTSILEGHTIPLVALSSVLTNVHYLVKLFLTFTIFYRFCMSAC